MRKVYSLKNKIMLTSIVSLEPSMVTSVSGPNTGSLRTTYPVKGQSSTIAYTAFSSELGPLAVYLAHIEKTNHESHKFTQQK